MLLLPNNKVTYTLDPFIDIERFLSLETNFYHLFASNVEKANDTWNSASINEECEWSLPMNRLLYYVYHKMKDIDPNIKELEHNRAKLAFYLKLKYNCYSPYKALQLYEFKTRVFDWVSEPIKEWVKDLPFEELDMITLLYIEHGCPAKFHRDFNSFPIEMGDNREPGEIRNVLWMRFDLNRVFNFYDFDKDGNKLATYPVEGYSATFNHFNWHGNEVASETAYLTLKVEGKFTDEFYNKIYSV